MKELVFNCFTEYIMSLTNSLFLQNNVVNHSCAEQGVGKTENNGNELLLTDHLKNIYVVGNCNI